jgi:alkanesulfonate monooxygenase SsuD/methylene tetrahydromethanopterin reductase-like flavin-dependent oxidoreductase (luciferase family)
VLVEEKWERVYHRTDTRFGLGILPTPDTGKMGEDFPKKIHRYLDEAQRHFETIIVPDHISSLSGSTEGSYILEGLTTGAYLLAAYPRLKLETMVLCNSYRNPALLAKASSTLNEISGGRFTLGIGAGWVKSEYSEYGFDYPSNEVRVRQLEEAVQIIRGMWTEDHFTFKGKYYQVNDSSCYPKPANPTLMIGGTGEHLMLRVVAKYANKWNVSMIGDPSVYKVKVEALRRHCGKVGRDYDEIVKSQLHLVTLADSDADAREMVKRGGLCGMCDVVGSPRTVVEQLRKHADLGIDEFRFYFMPFPNIEGTQLFVDEVMPEI